MKWTFWALPDRIRIAWKSGRKLILKFSPQADFNFVHPCPKAHPPQFTYFWKHYIYMIYYKNDTKVGSQNLGYQIWFCTRLLSDEKERLHKMRYRVTMSRHDWPWKWATNKSTGLFTRGAIWCNGSLKWELNSCGDSKGDLADSCKPSAVATGHWHKEAFTLDVISWRDVVAWLMLKKAELQKNSTRLFTPGAIWFDVVGVIMTRSQKWPLQLHPFYRVRQYRPTSYNQTTRGSLISPRKLPAIIVIPWQHRA